MLRSLGLAPIGPKPRMFPILSYLHVFAKSTGRCFCCLVFFYEEKIIHALGVFIAQLKEHKIEESKKKVKCWIFVKFLSTETHCKRTLETKMPSPHKKPMHNNECLMSCFFFSGIIIKIMRS